MYCSNCGTRLENGELFCPECGTSHQTVEKLTSEKIIKEVPMHNGEKNYVQIPKKQKKRVHGLPIFRLIASGVIVIISISLLVKLLPIGRELKSGKHDELESITVTYMTPSASLAGVDVDVNPLNLSDGDKVLTVEKLKENMGEDGFLGTEYEISLGDQHYLRAPLTITIPYDEQAAKDSYVTILHYDQDDESWVPLDTEINSQEHTATAKLTSLSPVRMVYFDRDYSGSLYYIENQGHTNAVMRVSYNYWDFIKNSSLEPASIVAQDYMVNGNTISSTEQMIKDGGEAINKVNTYYTLFGALGDTLVSSVGLLAPAGSALEKATGKVSKGIGIISLVIAGTQLMYDLETKDSTGPRNETAINLYKNMATNTGTLYSFCTGYSSAAFTAGFFAVAVTGYVLDTLIEEAKTIQADTVEAIFNTYYEDYSGFKETDWYNVFVDAYWDAWQNNRGSEEGMNYAIKKVTDAINAHAEKFWTEIYKEGSDALTFAVTEAGEKNYFTPTADQKAELTASFKKDLFKRFNDKAMPWINEFMQQRMKEAVYSSLLKIVEPYNQYYTVQIQEIAPQDRGDVCQFQNCPIRFANVQRVISTPFPEEWELQAPEDDDEWAVKQDFTLMGYIMAEAPERVLFFNPSEKEILYGKHTREETLLLKGEDEGYTTLIDLSGGDINLSGTYELNAKGTKTIKRITSKGDWTDSSRNSYDFNGLQAVVTHKGKDMVISLSNEAETILTGKYNPMTLTFTGRDNKETREFSADLFSIEDITFVFDVSSTPIKATGHLNVPRSRVTEKNMTTLIMEFAMTRISE